MQRPLNDVYNVGEETWLPAPADNRITNYDLATRAGQYSRFPGAQGPFERFDLTRTSATAFSGPTGSRRSPSTDTPSPGSSCKWEGEGKGEAASGFPLPSRAIGLPRSRWPGPHTPARDSKPSTEGSAATRVCQAAFDIQHPEQEEAGPVERIPVSKRSASRAGRNRHCGLASRRARICCGSLRTGGLGQHGGCCAWRIWLLIRRFRRQADRFAAEA